MAVADSPPSLDILVRNPEGFTIWNGPPFSNGEPRVKLDKVPCTTTKFSENGSKLMVIRSDSLISIYDSKNLIEIRSLQVPNVLAASISPCGTYVQTFQKSTSPQDKNVVLWKTDTGDSVFQVFQKNMTKTTWPSIRFSSDEAVACRLATNEVQFFDPKDFSKGINHRLRCLDLLHLSFLRLLDRMWLYLFQSRRGCQEMFKYFLVQRSYRINLLPGKVSLGKEGPVHDVQWSFSGKEFAVVYGCFGNLPGDMIAMTGIREWRNGEMVICGLVNLCCYDRFLVRSSIIVDMRQLGQNFPVQAFWDYLEKKKLGATKAELSVTSEWSPDGRYFMTATTAPRLQVDNGIKIFHHNGSLYFKRMFDKLFQVEWKPELPDKFGDIAELLNSVDSFKLEETRKQGQGSKTAQAHSKTAASNPSVQKPAAYRPPHAKAAAAVQAEVCC
ncbi:hypothetical protein DH2020_020220 [Rehmannia glutinosa]|uniref:Eukaryotic translation initiation factor 2A n=1 Tax=Rehmannia glutinosa TaxID=99300 RepID=A0ABR0WHL9_REHGL